MREREVEAEIAAVFPESRLPQELLTAGPLPGILQLSLLHLQSFSGLIYMIVQRWPPHQPWSLSNGDVQATGRCSSRENASGSNAMTVRFQLGSNHRADVASCPATYARPLCTDTVHQPRYGIGSIIPEP